MFISGEKRTTLITWVGCIVRDTIADLKNVILNPFILLQLLRKMDPETSLDINSQDFIKNTIEHIKGFFPPSTIDSGKIINGDNELEVAKFLCLILELTLTSEHNNETIEKIQELSAEIKNNIMCITQLVCTNNMDANLGHMLSELLMQGGSTQPVACLPSPVFSPVMTSTGIASPKGGDLSPLYALQASPHAMCRRLQTENKKLRQKVRHSEIFLKQQSQFDSQLAADVEQEKDEATSMLKTKIKECQNWEHQFLESQQTISKLKEEVEFLQLQNEGMEIKMRDSVLEARNAKESSKSLQNTLEAYRSIEEKLNQKESIYQEQYAKNTSLMSNNEKLTEEIRVLNAQLLQVNESNHQLKEKADKARNDFSDQIAHLELELKRRNEKMLQGQAEQQENIGEAMAREGEVTRLKAEVKSQTETIRNMGAHAEQQAKQIQALENERKENMTMVETYEAMNNKYMEDKEKLVKKLEDARQGNTELNATIIKLENSLEQSKSTSSEDMKQLQEQITQRETKEDELSKKLTRSKMREDESKAKLQTSLQQLESQRVVLQNFQQNEKIFKENETRLQANISELEEELKNTNDVTIEKYKKENLQYVAQIEGLSKKVSEQQNKEGHMTKQISCTEEKCKVLDEQLKSLEETEKKIKGEFADYFKELEAKCTASENKYEEMKEKNRQNEMAKEILEKQRVALEERCSVDEKRIVELEVSSRKNDFEKSSAEKREKRFKDENENIESERKHLEERCEIAENKCAELEGRLLRSESEDALRERCEATERLYQESEARLQLSERRCQEITVKQREWEDHCKELEKESRLNTESNKRSFDDSIEKEMPSKETETGRHTKKARMMKGEPTTTDESSPEHLYLNDLRKVTPSSANDSSFSPDELTLDDIQIESESNCAEELFRRSRSMRATKRKSLTLTNKTRITAQPTSVERRRTMQPRRYLSGRTPPGRRTGPSAQVQMCSLMTVDDEEPEEQHDWNQLAALKEDEVGKRDEDREGELHRRNTLCLPHLQSSYPLEMDGKAQETQRRTFKKSNTDRQLRSNSDLLSIGRTIRSESNLGLQTTPAAAPIKGGLSFDIMEPPKAKRPPQFTRSTASLKSTADEAKQDRQQAKKVPPQHFKSSAAVASKPPMDRRLTRTISSQVKPTECKVEVRPLNNNSGVIMTSPRNSARLAKVENSQSMDSLQSTVSSDDLLTSSFSRSASKRRSMTKATQKLVSSFRGKMINKNRR